MLFIFPPHVFFSLSKRPLAFSDYTDAARHRRGMLRTLSPRRKPSPLEVVPISFFFFFLFPDPFFSRLMKEFFFFAGDDPSDLHYLQAIDSILSNAESSFPSLHTGRIMEYDDPLNLDIRQQDSRMPPSLLIRTFFPPFSLFSSCDIKERLRLPLVPVDHSRLLRQAEKSKPLPSL